MEAEISAARERVNCAGGHAGAERPGSNNLSRAGGTDRLAHPTPPVDQKAAVIENTTLPLAIEEPSASEKFGSR
jgi:hypothetical protein